MPQDTMLVFGWAPSSNEALYFNVRPAGTSSIVLVCANGFLPFSDADARWVDPVPRIVDDFDSTPLSASAGDFVGLYGYPSGLGGVVHGYVATGVGSAPTIHPLPVPVNRNDDDDNDNDDGVGSGRIGVMLGVAFGISCFLIIPALIIVVLSNRDKKKRRRRAEAAQAAQGSQRVVVVEKKDETAIAKTVSSSSSRSSSSSSSSSSSTKAPAGAIDAPPAYGEAVAGNKIAL